MKKVQKISFIIKQNLISLLILISLYCIVSCSKSDNNDNKTIELPIIQNNPREGGYPIITKQVRYVNLPIPAEPQKLIFDLKENDVPISAIKDTVVVFIEGGPSHTASSSDLADIKTYINPENFPNFSVVSLRQAHNVNPTVFGSGRSFTADNAQEINDKTNNILKTVIKWLKSNHKVVYVFGHSNGSFIIQDYMSSNNINPDGYIISATRLKTIPAFFDNYPKNNDVTFTNGITPVITQVPVTEIPYFNVMSKLQLNHMKDYITLLANNPMLPKTVYLLSSKDEALGKTEQDEDNFLNNITNIKFPEGTHGEAVAGIPDALKFLRKSGAVSTTKKIGSSNKI